MNNNKPKTRVAGEVLLVAAMLFNSLAVTLMIKADFGISPISSIPYVLSVAFPAVSLGTWNAVMQCFWLLLTMLIIRKFKPGYLFSFVLAFIFGFLLDGWTGMMADWPMAMAWRLAYYIIGFCFMAAGIASFLLCGTPVLPYDAVPRAFVMEKGLSVRTARTGFEVISLVASLSLSLLLLGRVIGIGVGTVVSALFMGTLASMVTKWMQQRLDTRPHFEVLGKLV